MNKYRASVNSATNPAGMPVLAFQSGVEQVVAREEKQCEQTLRV